jgi:hypothetical protein
MKKKGNSLPCNFRGQNISIEERLAVITGNYILLYS